MNIRMTIALPMAVVICLAWAGAVFGLCFESAAGGQLRSGRMTAFLPKILDSYVNSVPKGAVYAVQTDEGYYFKICDEADQVDYFIKKWAEPKFPGGTWAPLYTTTNPAELSGYIQEGVYLIRRDGDNWAIWNFAAGEVPKSKLYVQTTPAEARIRVLNIRPRFSQGMELDAGRYHIEVSAKGFQTDKQWIDVKPGEDAILTVRLKPAG